MSSKAADVPNSESADPRETYDVARESCLVHKQGQQVVVYGHPEVTAVVTQPDLYSSAVSRFLQLPNGLDGFTHQQWRALIDPYLNNAQSLKQVEQMARKVMTELLRATGLPSTVEAVTALGARYTVRVQLLWLGWAPDLEERLLEWVNENRQASRSGDREWTARVASEFDALIRSELERHRNGPFDDPTTRLMNERIDGRPLQDEELVSILRNWTAGDLGSLALCVGVVVHFLATHPDLQHKLRSGVTVKEMEEVLDEILRIDDPFVANRRLVTHDTELAGTKLSAGDVVQVNWTAANRDSRVFSEPDAFHPARNRPANLVYGTGPHACPGRRLSTLELRVFTEELLNATLDIQLAGPTVREQFPGGGYAKVPVTLR